MKIDLLSPHAPVAAAERLKAAVAGPLTNEMPRRVTGAGTEQRMRLWVHRPNFRSDLRTQLVATMEPHRGGTRIRGRLGTPRWGMLFLVCWFGFLLFFAAISTAGSIASGKLVDPMFFVVPGLMALFGAGFTYVATMHGAADREMILAFLNETLGTRPHRHGARDLLS